LRRLFLFVNFLFFVIHKLKRKRRTQKDYSISFKLQIVQQIELAQLRKTEPVVYKIFGLNVAIIILQGESILDCYEKSNRTLGLRISDKDTITRKSVYFVEYIS